MKTRVYCYCDNAYVCRNKDRRFQVPKIELTSDEAKMLDEAIGNYLVHLHRQIARADDSREFRQHLVELEQFLHDVEERLRKVG